MVRLTTYALGRGDVRLCRGQVSDAASRFSGFGGEVTESRVMVQRKYHASLGICRSSSPGSEANKGLMDATRPLFQLKETCGWILRDAEATSLIRMAKVCPAEES